MYENYKKDYMYQQHIPYDHTRFNYKYEKSEQRYQKGNQENIEKNKIKTNTFYEYKFIHNSQSNRVLDIINK